MSIIMIVYVTIATMSMHFVQRNVETVQQNGNDYASDNINQFLKTKSVIARIISQYTMRYWILQNLIN